MDYLEEARKLVQNLDQRMGPSPYDIAWMARLKTPEGKTVWPDLVDWLLENQHPDGSWGGQIVYYHDRLICTLAAIIALHQNEPSQSSQQAIKRGERYLWRHLDMLSYDLFELAGFELILPTLLDEARSAGLDVPTHAAGYEEIQTAKMRLIPPHMLYSPQIATVHTLEYLGQKGDVGKLCQARASDGSLGNSPATTAYYLLLCNGQDEQAIDYLQAIQAHGRRPMVMYPFRTFELVWTLNNLQLSRIPIIEFVDPTLWELLKEEMGPRGIGLDSSFGAPSGNLTAVSSRLLLSAGYDIDPSTLARFQNKKTDLFHTYEFERNISISTNIHAMEALMVMPDYPEYRKVREQISLMLLDSRKYKMFWVDKWHASPYYATAHAVIGLLREGAYLLHQCHNTIDWLVHTQRADGSWGFFECGTAEETAYTLTALLFYTQYEPIDANILQRGAAFLARALEEPAFPCPALWIDKCLFAPYDIVRSAILSALILYIQVFGHSP